MGKYEKKSMKIVFPGGYSLLQLLEILSWLHQRVLVKLAPEKQNNLKTSSGHTENTNLISEIQK